MPTSSATPGLASLAEVRAILAEPVPASAGVPPPAPDALERTLTELPQWWFSRARPEVVAAEILLCAAPLGETEVRTLYRPSADPSVCVLSVVGRRGTGLLPGLAAVLADEGLLAARAEMVTWGSTELIRATLLRPGIAVDDSGWRRICDRIEIAVGTDFVPSVRFEPQGPVSARCVPAGERTMVVVEAPHRVGLLWATCSWLAAAGCQPEEMQTESSGPVRQSAYLVRGPVDAAALAAALSGPGGGGMLRSIGRPVSGLRRLAGRLLG